MKELEVIKARAEKAHHGPWFNMVGTFGKIKDPKSATVYATGADLMYIARCDGSQITINENYDAISTADFIAHSRTDVPKLVGIAEIALARFDDIVGWNADEESVAMASNAIKQIKAILEGKK